MQCISLQLQCSKNAFTPLQTKSLRMKSLEAPLEDLERQNFYLLCVYVLVFYKKDLLTSANGLEVVIEEISHDDEMPELRHQDDVSRQAAARVVGKLLERAEPEDQLKDTREA